jgi:hypothetical protein
VFLVSYLGVQTNINESGGLVNFENVQTNKKGRKKNPAFAGSRLGLKGFDDILGSGEPDVRPVMSSKGERVSVAKVSYRFLIVSERAPQEFDRGDLVTRVSVNNPSPIDDGIDSPLKVGIDGLDGIGEEEVSGPLA